MSPPRMSPRAREIYRSVRAVLDDAGLAYTLDNGGKHFRLRVSGFSSGRTRSLTIPSSPGDQRAVLNTVSQARHLLREEGEKTR